MVAEFYAKVCIQWATSVSSRAAFAERTFFVLSRILVYLCIAVRHATVVSIAL